MIMDFGTLERVSLRDVWDSEDRDFTPWLAQEENLQILGKALQMNIVLEAMEEEVGSFRADLLARNIADGQLVLIENQLERTNHQHLGQIITYASGLRVNTLVWVAEIFTNEHLAAIDWLNEMTNEHLRLFAVEIELWRIANSPVALKFNVVAKPNRWRRRVETAVRNMNARDVRRKSHNQQQIENLYAAHGWDYFTVPVKADLANLLGITVRTIDRILAQIRESAQQCLNNDPSEDMMSEPGNSWGNRQ